MSKRNKNQKLKLDDESIVFDTFYDADIETALCRCFEINGTLTLYPKGDSMLPTLTEGKDSVELSPVRELTVNRIYFYKRSNGRYVLHRLLKIKNGVYIFSGDNQLVYENVKEDQIIACVSQIYKKNKPKGCFGCGKIFLLINSNRIFRKLFIRFRGLKNRFSKFLQRYSIINSST